jgi:hypothetical protein
MKPLVFIVYTNIDGMGKRFGGELHQILRKSEYDVFFYDHSSEDYIGTPTFSVLSKEIGRRDIVLVICTPAIRASYGAEYEINHALVTRKMVVPIRYGKAQIPDPILGKTPLDFGDDNYNSKFEHVAEILPRVYQEHLRMQGETEKARASFSPPTGPKTVHLTEPSARAEADKLIDSIVKEYYKESVVDYVSIVEDYDQSVHGKISFRHIGLLLPTLRKWIGAPDQILIVDTLGSSVALGERNYLSDLWSDRIEIRKYSPSNLNLRDFSSILGELSAGLNPTALFVPIKEFGSFSRIMMEGITKGVSFWGTRAGHILLQGKEIKVFFSNKFAPLEHFILVDRSATRWYVKTEDQFRGRILATLVENEKDPDKVDFLVKTVVKADLVNPNRVRIFSFE